MKYEKRSKEILKNENYTWQDMIIFLMDEHLEEFMLDMKEQGCFDLKVTEDEIYYLMEYVEKKVRENI